MLPRPRGEISSRERVKLQQVARQSGKLSGGFCCQVPPNPA